MIDQETAMMTMMTTTMMMTRAMPIITFLFFHHILFFTFREVSRKSYDCSARVSLFFTRIYIFSPLSIILSIFLRDCSSRSLSSFLKLDNLSTSVLLLYFPIHSCRMGLKSLSECPTAWFLFALSYLAKKVSCIFLRKLAAMRVSYCLRRAILLIRP